MLHWTHSTKWQRYNTLKRELKVLPYLPETVRYSQRNLVTLLEKYDSVFLKPITGTGGSGIIKIYFKEPYYIMHYLKYKIKINSLERLFYQISRIMNHKHGPYMIQQGIDLISINNRPIDFRVLLLKPYNEWLPMGIMGKLGVEDKIVTNKCRGGKPILFNVAIARTLGLNNTETINLEKKIFSLGVNVGKALSKDYRYVRELGMDIAIDKNSNFYILEVNAMPRYNLFKYHNNRALYPQIAEYIHHIRRNYRRKYV